MNKKIIFFLLVLSCCSTKIFADIALGFNSSFNLNNAFNENSELSIFESWSLGGSLGFGSMRGRPFIIEILAGESSFNDLRLKMNLDWHILPMNLSHIVQIFLGLGIGGQIDFDPSEVGKDNKHEGIQNVKPIVYGRIPVGIKFLVKDCDFFLNVVPQLGWGFELREFYWSFEIGTGFRLWF